MKIEESFMTICEKLGTKYIWNEEKIDNYYKEGEKIIKVQSHAESTDSSDITSGQKMFSCGKDFDVYDTVTRRINIFVLMFEKGLDKKKLKRMSGYLNESNIFTTMYFEDSEYSARLRIEVNTEYARDINGIEETRELFNLLNKNHKEELIIEYKNKFIEIPGNDR